MWKAATSTSGDDTGRKKSAMHRNGSTCWRGNENRAATDERDGDDQITTSFPSLLAGKYPYTTCGSSTPDVRAASSCVRRTARTRVRKSASLSPADGRNPHWLRNNAVSLRYVAISSIATPRTTCDPQNGGTGTGTSVATVGALGGTDAARARGARAGRSRPPGSRPQAGSSSAAPFLMAASWSITRSPSNASFP